MADDFVNNITTTGRLFLNQQSAGELEEIGDRDWFRLRVTKDTTYEFDVEGVDTAKGTLEDPFIRVFRDNFQQLVFNNNGGTDDNAKVRFRSDYTGFAYIEASAFRDLLTGTYRVRAKIAADDCAAGFSTDCRVVVDQGAVTGKVETRGDIDAFKGALQKNVWYRAVAFRNDSNGTPLEPTNLIVRNPDASVAGSDFDSDDARVIFRADASGDHLFTVRGDDTPVRATGDYRLVLTEVKAAEPTARSFNTEVGNRNNIQRLFGFRTYGNTIEEYEFYDANDVEESGFISQNGTEVDAKTVVNVSAADLGTLKFEAATEGRIVDSIHSRIKVNGVWSAWTTSDVTTDPAHVSTMISAAKRGSFRFSFEDTLPDNLDDGNFDGFASLTELQKEGFRRALKTWADSIDLRVVEVASGDGHVRIFGANGNGFVGTSGGGSTTNIVYNLANSEMNNPQEGQRGFMNLVRTIGKVLKINPATGLPAEFDTQSFSVMSNIAGPDSFGVFPSSPMLYDLNAAVALYGVGENDPTSRRYEFDPDRPTFATINDTVGDDDVISAEFLDTSVTIDLRGGRSSSVTVDGTVTHQFFNSYLSTVENAIGTNADDVIFGNRLDNTIDGSGGADVLYGFQGDDLLLGGQGDDKYIASLGGGNDTIREFGLGGADVIEYTSWFELDQFSNDLSFSRIDDDLMIDLNFNRRENISEGSITIVDMAQAGSQVETLRLLNGDGTSIVPDISLVSVFSGLDIGETKRFRLDSGSDSFGRLVTPV